MVVGFVLKHKQPVLIHTIVVNRHIDTAGVDFLRLVQIRDQPAFFDFLGADHRHIHKGHGTVSIFAVKGITGRVIAFKGFLNRFRYRAALKVDGFKAG